MDYVFLAGLAGSIVLITGAAWPEKTRTRPAPPVKSFKNWLFAVGGLIMTLYSVLGYLAGGSVFFVFLQILILISTILMMLDLNDVIDMAVISLCGLVLVIWSLTLFTGYVTLIFIAGLMAVGMGYAFNGTIRRNAALTIGSILIAAFSYTESNWIFFWLNAIFAVFSGYYLAKELASKKRTKN
jgi:hypothetical protein